MKEIGRKRNQDTNTQVASGKFGHSAQSQAATKQFIDEQSEREGGLLSVWCSLYYKIMSVKYIKGNLNCVIKVYI